MNNDIETIAPLILEAIKSSKKILLHCHPSADADSAGSVLAMTMALKKLGKVVVPIMGDSKLSRNLLQLPKHELLVEKNYIQINPDEFDLFIIQDSSAPDFVSQLGEVVFPKTMKTVVIDHHVSNQGFGDINLVMNKYSSTCQVLYKLFTLWNVEIDPDMALCLFLGIYADTGGFKYQNTSSETLLTASKLVEINPNFQESIFQMQNNRDPQEIEFMGMALSSVKTYFSGNVAIAGVTMDEIIKHGLLKENTHGGIADTLISVTEWNIGVNIVEIEPNVVIAGFRTRDENVYDVSKIAKALGGGGHKAASGAKIRLPLEKAREKILETIKDFYPNLGN